MLLPACPFWIRVGLLVALGATFSACGARSDATSEADTAQSEDTAQLEDAVADADIVSDLTGDAPTDEQSSDAAVNSGDANDGADAQDGDEDTETADVVWVLDLAVADANDDIVAADAVGEDVTADVPDSQPDIASNADATPSADAADGVPSDQETGDVVGVQDLAVADANEDAGVADAMGEDTVADVLDAQTDAAGNTDTGDANNGDSAPGADAVDSGQSPEVQQDSDGAPESDAVPPPDSEVAEDAASGADGADGANAGDGAVAGDGGSVALCADLTACADANPCTTDLCNPVTGCYHVANGISCDDGQPCTVADICKETTCVGQLSPTACDDANKCTDDACSQGTCVHTANGADCSDDNPCNYEACENGTCVSTTNNDPCEDGTECTFGDMCINNTCTAAENICTCETTADCVEFEDGDACNGTLVCKDKGCVLDLGTIVGCGEAGNCSAQYCDYSSGTCVTYDYFYGTPCDDGDLCSSSDFCAYGSCAGTLGCDDGDPCTVDACGDSGCTHGPVTGESCSDGNLCTTNDSCVSGVCVGQDTTCDGPEGCHLAGVCDPNTGECVSPNSEDGTTCTDGNLCTVNDACTSGVCAGTAAQCGAGDQCLSAGSCDPATGACIGMAPLDGIDCNDGNKCTQFDACKAGVCGGVQIACGDNNPCHVAGKCDVMTGACVIPNAPAGYPCDDGDLCTTSDGCYEGNCTGTTPTCPPAGPCLQAPACDPATGSCDATADLSAPAEDGTLCEDGNLCTVNDSCVSGTCQSGGQKECPLSPCSPTATCEATTGTCIAEPFPPNSPTHWCDDGLECTWWDQCIGTMCVGTMMCDDSNECTADSCAEGACVHTPLQGTCGSGQGLCENGICSYKQQNGWYCWDDTACLSGFCRMDDTGYLICQDCNTADPGHCGNGVVQAGCGETCDDGNTADLDGCNSTCKPETCGDGVVQIALLELCDNGSASNSDFVADACRSNCVKAACGDFVVDSGEACDLGPSGNSNVLPNGCRTNCMWAWCGDGVRDTGEECDDGNKNGDDGCDSTCQQEGCGDNIVQSFEECDDGNKNSGDGCGSNCKKEFCGDSVVQPGEECDAGPLGNATCDTNCVLRPCTGTEACGDGVDNNCNGNIDEDCQQLGVVSYMLAGSNTPALTVIPAKCTHSYDCNDENSYTTDTCTAGACTYKWDSCDGPDMDACTDGRHLTQDGPCTDTGPMLLWNFTQTSGGSANNQVVLDASGEGRTGIASATAPNTPASVLGKFGNGMRLVDGSVSSNLDMPKTNFTLSLWFNTTKDGGLVSQSYVSGGKTQTDREMYISAGKVGYRVAPGASSNCSGEGPNVVDGKWHLATLVCESGVSCRLLVDGVRICQSLYFDSASAVGAGTQFRVGYSELGGYLGKDVGGSVDEVALFAYPMRDEEVLSRLLDHAATSPGEGNNSEQCDGQDHDCNGVPNSSCDDGTYCTTDDHCSGSSCVGTAKVLDCEDGNVCTADLCDPTNGTACLHQGAVSLFGTACDDSNGCTAIDACTANGLCTGTMNTCTESTASFFPADPEVVIYRLRGSETDGAIVPMKDAMNSWGKWKPVPGNPGWHTHAGPVVFWTAKPDGKGGYTLSNPIPVLTQGIQVHLAPFLMGGMITVPFPTQGFMKDINLAPPPVGLNAPYLALGVGPGASLDYLQAPLDKGRDYIYLSGLLGGQLAIPAMDPMTFGAQVTFVLDPFDPMFYLSLDAEKSLGGAAPKLGTPLTFRSGALGFSLGGNMVHTSKLKVWDGSQLVTPVNNAHVFGALEIGWSPVPALDWLQLALKGKVSADFDPKGDGYDPTEGFKKLADKVFKNDWNDADSSINKDFAIMVEGVLKLILVPTVKGKPVQVLGKKLAVPIPLAKAVAKLDTTPNHETFDLRGQTNVSFLNIIPGMQFLMPPVLPEMDVFFHLKKDNELVDWTTYFDITLHLYGGPSFGGQVTLDDQEVRLDGTFNIGRYYFNDTVFFDIGYLQTSMMYDIEHERFCMGSPISKNKVLKDKTGQDQNTSCEVTLCIGKNGFAGTHFSCQPFCVANDQCPSDKPACYFGVCAKAVPNGAPCTDNSQCQDKHCFAGSCVSCWPGQSECGDNKFCDAAGYCQNLLANGETCINLSGQGDFMRGDWCKSGQCDTQCVECVPPTPDGVKDINSAGTSTCGAGKYCDDFGNCQDKLGSGKSCYSGKGIQGFGSWCASSSCGDPAWTCRECGVTDSNGKELTCGDGFYCDDTFKTCQAKVSDGSVCYTDKVCQSGSCSALAPIPGSCYTAGSKTYGAGCLKNAECASDNCQGLFCGCGGNSGYCPVSGQNCIAGNVCVTPAPSGTPCTDNGECVTGKCAGVCVDCFNDGDCGSGNLCILGGCSPPLSNGTPCGADKECASSHCVAARCVECASQSDCGDSPQTKWCDAAGSCQPLWDDGHACASAIECKSTYCSNSGVIPGSCYSLNSKNYGAGCVYANECKSSSCTAIPGIGNGTFCNCNGSNSNCPGGQNCVTGNVCITPVGNGLPCIESGGCTSGHCAGVACVECMSDGHCSNGNICVAGACVVPAALGVPCVDNHNCASGKCAGVCVSCLSDNDCPGQVCLTGACVQAPLGTPCTTDTFCGSGHCTALKCSECSVAADCGNGKWCDASGACQPLWDDGHACASAGECKNGHCSNSGIIPGSCYSPYTKAYGNGCVYSDECASQSCTAIPALGNGTFCNCNGSSTNCPSGQNCMTTNTCITPLPNATPCTEDAMCASSHCSGSCVQCKVDAHCSGGNICFAGACVVPAALGVPCTEDRQCASNQCAGVCVECKSNGNCAGGSCYLGACTSMPIGTPCTANDPCASGHCVNLKCSECSVSSDCGGGKWCDAVGSCQPLWSDGHACASSIECNSGHCSNSGVIPGSCYSLNTKGYGAGCVYNNECASSGCTAIPLIGNGTFCNCNGSSNFCPGGQACVTGNVCVTPSPNGTPCTEDASCASTHCAGLCVQCSSDSHCGGGQFCDAGACKAKLATATPCTSNSMCQTGMCSGVCVDCQNSGQCGGGQYCDNIYCQNKKGYGAVCTVNDAECASGQCVAAYCGCAARDENCPGGQYCDNYTCFGKKGGGDLCSRGGECQSGSCNGGICGCANDSQCGGTAFCNGGTCTAKYAAGMSCGGGNQCISGNCQYSTYNCNPYDCNPYTCFIWFTCYNTCYNTCSKDECTLF